MKKSINYSEQTMVTEFCNTYLSNKQIRFSVEVPFFDKSIDLVYLVNNKYYAIEFKLNNWKKAIEQAKNHMIGADYIYICLPSNKKYNENELENELKKNNCGLLLFDVKERKVYSKIKPKRNKSVIKRGKERLINGFNYSIANDNFNLLTTI